MGDLFGDFQRNIQNFGVEERIEALRMTTLEAAERFEASSLDLVLVDAAHDYASVRADLVAWYPKIKAGGLLFCDDYHPRWPGVIEAVDSMMLEGQLAVTALWFHRKPPDRSPEAP